MNIKPPCCNDVGLAAASLRSNRRFLMMKNEIKHMVYSGYTAANIMQ